MKYFAMKRFPAVSRRFYIIGGMIFFLTIIFGYYFFIFLPQKEKNIIAQRVRALNQIEKNFKQKYRVYEKTFNDDGKNSKDIEEGIKEIIRQKKLVSLLKTRWNNNKDKDTIRRSWEINKMIADEKSFRQKLKPLENSLEDVIDTVKSKLGHLESELNIKLLYDKENYDPESSIIFNGYLFANFTKFFAPLRLSDSFDGYVVYRDSTLTYQDVPGEVLRVPALLYRELDTQETIDQRYVRQNLEARKPERFDNPRVYEAGTDIQLAASDYKLFSTHFMLNNGNKDVEWTIYSLVSKQKFEAEKKKIPFFGTVILSAFLLLLLFSMPLLKLFYMSAIERLHRTDVVLASPALMFCTSIVVLLTLLITYFYFQEIPVVEKKLQTLNDNIQEEFENELEEINGLAEKFKDHSPEVIKVESDKKNGISLISDWPAGFPNVNELKKLHPTFRTLYWLDKDGEQKFEYATIRPESISKTPNYSNREYFKNIEKEKSKSFFYNNKKNDPFYLQSILSYTTGEPISVFSKPSINSKVIIDNDSEEYTPVLAVATVLQSLTEMVLPPAYSFMVIDQEGEVLFHQDKQKNLQENFLLEIDRDSKIEAAITGQSDAFSDVVYYHHNYRAYIQPMQFLPWYLVTTYDKAYLETPYLNILTFVLLGMVLIATAIALQVALVSLTYSNNSTKLKKKSFAFNWLWPYREERETKKNQHRQENSTFSRSFKYLICTLITILLIGELILLVSRVELVFTKIIAACIYASVFSYISVFAILKKEIDIKYWKVIVGSVILSFIVWITVASNTYNYSMDNWFRLFMWFLIALVCRMVFHFTKNIRFGNYREVYQNNFFDTKTIARRLDPFFKKNDSITYFFMIYTYVILVGGITTYLIFSKAYEQEMLIWRKYDLYQIRQSIEKRESWINDTFHYNNSKYEEFNNKTDRILTAKKWSLRYKDVGFGDVLTLPTPLQVQIFSASHERDIDWRNRIMVKNYLNSSMSNNSVGLDSLIYEIRSKINGFTTKTNSFVFNNSKDPQKWNFFYTLSDRKPKEVLLKNGTEYLSASVPTMVLSKLFFYNNESINWFLTLFIAIFLFGLYGLIKYMVVRMFGVGSLQYLDIIQLDENLEEAIIGGGETHQFYVALPFANLSMTSVKEKMSDADYDKIYQVDLSTELNEDSYKDTKDEIDKINRVVLNHFSYGINDFKVNLRRQQLLERLLSRNIKVTILSTLTPLQITEKYEEQIDSLDDSEKKQTLENHVMRWKEILAGFAKFYYSDFVYGESEKVFNTRQRLPQDPTLLELVKHELTAYPTYFKRLSAIPFMELVDNNEVKFKGRLSGKDNEKNEDLKEEVLFKIQSIAEPLYLSLWNTCSKEEKYLLYDLADDGFVNTKNKQILMRLMEKGLIFYDESFQIMNESFRNFILSIVRPSEALAMENELERRGSWSTYSILIILVVISMVVFLIFAQESVIRQFTALIAGLTAIVPYMIRLGSMVPGVSRSE